MSSAFPFKMPSMVPQDLQLINELVGEIPVTSSKAATPSRDISHDDSIASSDSDSDSEREVEANILTGLESDVDLSTVPQPSDSATDESSSSDSDDSDEDEDEGKTTLKIGKPEEVDIDDLEDTGPTVTSEAQVRTKNETPEADIMIPDIDEVGPHEILEKVGEVMSMVDNIVIVKGSASEIVNRASQRALDSDTLLVFEDRKVLGYIYETFGPTSQPLYQIKFNEKYPLDPQKIQLSRPVFHVPERSNFIFVRQIQYFKGSDASNVHDEEPAEDELDFSDDEAEAAHKRALADRREQSRSRSVASSRHTTPIPSQMRDQDMSNELYGANPYDESGPYNDMDFSAGPSRPAPIPYDDPYSDSYGLADGLIPENGPRSPKMRRTRGEDGEPSNEDTYGDSDRGRGRRGQIGREMPGRRDDRGRGRGRDRQRGNRGRGRGRGRDDRGQWAGNDRGRRASSFSDEYAPHAPRAISPTSLAIARATGQYADGSALESNLHNTPVAMAQPNGGGWSYPQYPVQQQQDFSVGYQNQYVQPHINPRFASNFGMNFAFQQGNQYAPYGYGNMGYNNSGNYVPGWDQNWSMNAGTAPPENGAGSPKTGEGLDS